MDLVYIPKEDVGKVWMIVRPLIQDALAYSGNHHNVGHYFDLCKSGKVQLWLIWDKDKNTINERLNGVVITQIIQRSVTRVLHTPIVTGKNRQKWQHLIEKLENFAKDQGCDVVELVARPGWQKIMDKYNYKKTHVFLEKRIEKEKE